MAPSTRDVTIVGAGPVGLALARALGMAGHDVLVLERWPEPYPLPRAVHFDDEIGRALQSLGLADEVRGISAGVPDFYEWRNRDGECLVRIDWSGTGPCGWPTASFFSQPQLEQVLEEAVRSMENVTLLRAAEVVALNEHDDHVEVTYTSRTAKHRVVRSRYVVGCDGANSFVRGRMNTTMHDNGFFFDWLIVDTIPQDDTEWSPQNWQLCDPARPTTVVSGGPGRRRWEFMRLAGESRDELNSTEKAWALLEPWGRTPENTVLERHAVYTFAARWAEDWVMGRLAIAGDAAHQMPPFAGQGMCSGLRDAANLAWKLDRVLRGVSQPELLLTYSTERKAHLRHAIDTSIELGKVICVLDEEAAAARDARMLAGGADPAVVLPVGSEPVLGEGATAQGLGRHALSGRLSPQHPVGVSNGTTVLLDEARENGPRGLLLIDGRPDADHSPRIDESAELDVHVIGASAGVGDGSWDDPSGAWGQWFTEHGAVAVLIRPDHYVFGAVDSPEAITELAAEYASSLAPLPSN